MPQNTPSRQEMIEAIRAKCVAANPEIEAERQNREWLYKDKIEGPFVHRSIRLADVLLTMQKVKRFGSSSATYFDLCDSGFEFGFAGTTDWTMWDLRHDSLDDQADDCISPLYDLLS